MMVESCSIKDPISCCCFFGIRELSIVGNKRWLSSSPTGAEAIVFTLGEGYKVGRIGGCKDRTRL